MAQPLPAEPNPDKTRRRTLALGVALFLFAVYLLVYRGGFHSIDEVSIFAVTESLVKFGRANTDQIAWTQWTTSQAEAQGFFGQDGHVYSKKGLALSLAEAPLYWLGLMLPGLGMLQTVSVLNAFITAGTALILFMFLWRLNYPSPTVVLIPLIYGLATIAFVYAKYLFSEPLAGFLLLLAAYMLFTYRQEGGLRHVAIAGLAAGGSVLTRANNLFLLPLFGLYLLWIIRPVPPNSPLAKPDMGKTASEAFRSSKAKGFVRSAVAPVVVFILTVAVAGVILLGYNALRSGNPLETGYDLTLFSPNIPLGLYKLLFSPLRGLFVYSPILLLSLPGWWFFRQSRPAEAWLLAGLVGVTIGLFSAWSSGEGLSWGSRFLVPVVPFFVIGLAPLVEKVTGRQAQRSGVTYLSEASRWDVPRISAKPPGGTHHALRITFYALLLLSFLIQLLGVIINPWVYLAQLQADFGGEFFLENTAALYDFRYSQIAGQLRAWAGQNSDLVWWQPWGFDGLAFGLSLGLVILAGWLLWRAVSAQPEGKKTGKKTPLLLRPSTPLPLYVLLVLTISLTYFLLARYYVTDRQFGPPDDGYTQALSRIAATDSYGSPIVTVAQYYYHLPMNRFKGRQPLIGFAQQSWPPPDTALPLLVAATGTSNTWLVTVGLPPAAPDNAAEQWLARHTYKISDDWGNHDTRLLRFTPTPPTETRTVAATLGEVIRLETAAVLNPARPGQPLSVELAFDALTQPQADLTIFVQLLNIQGGVIAQTNSRPVGGYAPTPTWQPRQTIVSRHGLLVPPEAPPGDYRLITGLFDPTTGKRLPVNGDREFVDLGAVAIIPATEAGHR